MPFLQFPPSRSRPSLPLSSHYPFRWRHATSAIATRYSFISVTRTSRTYSCIGWLLRWRPCWSTNTAVPPCYHKWLLRPYFGVTCSTLGRPSDYHVMILITSRSFSKFLYSIYTLVMTATIHIHTHSSNLLRCRKNHEVERCH